MKTVWNWIIIACVMTTTLMAAEANGSGEPSGSVPVDVMTFNIRYGLADDGINSWDHRKQIVLDVIEKESPDLIGLQEALRFQLDSICEAHPEYGRIGIGRDPGGKGEYAAILYRQSRFDVDASGTFWLSDTPETPSANWGNKHLRICTWARLLDRTSDQFVYIFNTHYDHQSQNAREQSSRLLARRISGRKHRDPVIVTGDFNAGEDNPAITYLLEEKAIALADSFRKLYPDQVEVGTFNGFSGKSTGEKIDHVLVDTGFSVLEAGINQYNDNGLYPSDHFPVSSRLQVVTESGDRESTAGNK